MTKNIIITILSALFLISAGTTVSTLTSRSKEQVSFYSDNMSQVKSIMDSYYKSGYRVVFMVSQPVSTSVNSSEYNHAFHGAYRDLKGQIYVVMER